MKKIFVLILFCGLCLFAKGQSTPKSREKPLPFLTQELPGGNSILETATSETSTVSADGPQNCCRKCGECLPKTATAQVDPYSGNDHREVRDLEVWGGVGEVPLVWVRYANSRLGTYNANYGNAHNWTNSFQYDMRDVSSSEILIHYPEGGENVFVKSSNAWVPKYAGINTRLFQYGNDFYLQEANGFRYHFQKPGTGSGVNYQLKDFRDSYQNVYTLTYGLDGRLTRITEPAGRYLQVNDSLVNGMKVISSVVTNDGRSVHYTYAVFGDGTAGVRLSGAVYGDGNKATYTYVQYQFGTKPYLEHVVDTRYKGAAANMIYSYLSSPANGFFKNEKNGVTGQVMASLDTTIGVRKVCYPNGRTQIYNTPSAQFGKFNSHTDGLGNKSQYTYANGIGFRNSETDASGRVTVYNSRSTYGNLLQITHPDGKTESWTRDTLDLILTHTDELGRTTTYVRDAAHRITRMTNPDDSYEEYTYNGFGQVLDHRKRNGSVEHNTYDSRGLKTSFADALGNVTLYTHSAADLLQSMTDARGNTTSYAYDERGLLVKETNPDLSFKEFRYDSLGKRDTVTNELGKRWTTKYDEFSRVKELKDPLNRVIKYDYDLPGGLCGCSHSDNHPTRITLPSGKLTEIEYDVEWRKIRETVGAGTKDAASTFYEYDVAGNIVTVIDPKEKQWRTSYDVRNRTSSRTDPLGNKTQYMYDAVGNNLTAIRPDNGLTTTGYDNMNRPTQITDPKGQITKMLYDDDGNLTKFTDAKNNDYIFEYDVLDRKTKMIYPGGTFEQYTYDAVGNLKTYKNRNGETRTYTYDNRNREILSDWSDATPDAIRMYDLASRLTGMTSSVSALSYTYDDANELLSETQNISGAGGPKTVNYTYNVDGFRNTTAYPGGTTTAYTYTGRNQIQSVAATGLSSLYTYDLNGNRVSKVLSNGTSAVCSYDAANRILNVDNRKGELSFARCDYAYDNVNRRKYIQYDNGRGDNYGFDAIDQVTDVKYDVVNPDGMPSGPTRTVSYGLDANGNRTTMTDNGTPINYVTNNLNQYTSIGGNALGHNANGSLDSYNGWQYTYDAQNRLTRVMKGGTTVDFGYDVRNRCVKRTVNGSVTFLYYNGWNLIEERNVADVEIARYVHGARTDELITRISAANKTYYQYDALGSVIRLTDIFGDVIEKYTYDVFGEPIVKNNNGIPLSESAYSNRFFFTGREYIKEVALYDYRNRFYSSSFGKFLQPDPLEANAGDINIYRYVTNRPVSLTDPYGLCPSWYDYFKECMGVLGLPVPGSLFETAAAAIATAEGIVSVISDFGPGVTVGELVGAGTLPEALTVAGGVLASAYAGAIIGCAASATGKVIRDKIFGCCE